LDYAMYPAFLLRLCRRGCARRGVACGGGRIGATRRAVEEPEELRVRIQEHGRALRIKRLTIGCHGAIELEEVRITLKGFREDRVSLCFTLTTDDLGFTLRGSENLDHLTVRTGADTGSGFTAPCTQTLRLGQTLGLHALV